MIVIDKLSHSSKLCNKNPYLKTAFAIVTLCICIASRSLLTAAATIAVMGGLIITTSRASVRTFRHLFGMPFLFLLVGTATIVINISDNPFDLISVPLMGRYAGVSKASFFHGLQLITTAYGAVTCLYFLTLSTRIMDILIVFRRLHCPDVLVELMLLIYRYIFVLLDMADALSTAMKCRLSNRSYYSSLKGMGQMLSVLFVRSMKKASALYDAMDSRCYDGRIRILQNVNSVSGSEVVMAVGVEVVLILLWVCG